MSPLLRTADDLERLARHTDPLVRNWALERLAASDPERAGRAALERLLAGNTEDFDFLFDLVEALEDADTAGDLDDLMEELHGHEAVRVACHLAFIEHTTARSHLTDLLEELAEDQDAIDPADLLLLNQALAHLGGPDVAGFLFDQVEYLEQNEPVAGSVFLSCLLCGGPDRVAPLVQAWRKLPLDEEDEESVVQAVSYAVGADWFAIRSGEGGEGGDAAEEAGDDPGAHVRSRLDLGALAPETTAALQALDGLRYVPALRQAATEARRLVESRKEPWKAWRKVLADGRKIGGYRKRVVLGIALLDALAQSAPRKKAVEQAERRLAAGLLIRLAFERDDEALLECASDRTAALLEILAAPREWVYEDLHLKLALTPDDAARLGEILRTATHPMARGRAALAFSRLLRTHPSCGLAYLADFVALLREDDPDIALPARTCLVLLGEPALDALAAATDRTFWWGLTVSDIPTDRSLALLLPADGTFSAEADSDEILEHLRALAHPGCLERVLAEWDNADPAVAEVALTVALVNGLEHPAVPTWRETMNAWQAIHQMLEEAVDGGEGLDDAGEEEGAEEDDGDVSWEDDSGMDPVWGEGDPGEDEEPPTPPKPASPAPERRRRGRR